MGLWAAHTVLSERVWERFSLLMALPCNGLAWLMSPFLCVDCEHHAAFQKSGYFVAANFRSYTRIVDVFDKSIRDLFGSGIPQLPMQRTWFRCSSLNPLWHFSGHYYQLGFIALSAPNPSVVIAPMPTIPIVVCPIVFIIWGIGLPPKGFRCLRGMLGYLRLVRAIR